MIEPQDYLEYILKGLVAFPDDVKITRTQDSQGIFLEVELNPEDMGQAIGKGGKTVSAVRSLLHAAYGMKTNSRVSVKINDPEKDQMDAHSEIDESVAASGEPESEIVAE